jgi:inner membrane protein
MNPATHFLLGWLTANTVPLKRRERTLVTLAGVVPDVDGAGLLIEQATKNSAYPLLWWSKYHHVLAHNLLFGLFFAVVAFLLSTRRWKTAVLALISFHIHIFCDIIGARGPDGHQWPIPYLVPFSDQPQLAWDGQWALNAWPNFLITIVALIATFYLAWKRGYSPVGIFSPRGDQAFVSTLRKRFPHRNSAQPAG